MAALVSVLLAGVLLPSSTEIGISCELHRASKSRHYFTCPNVAIRHRRQFRPSTALQEKRKQKSTASLSIQSLSPNVDSCQKGVSTSDGHSKRITLRRHQRIPMSLTVSLSNKLKKPVAWSHLRLLLILSLIACVSTASSASSIADCSLRSRESH